MKKAIRLLALVLAMLMALTACGSKEPSGGKKDGAVQTAFEPKLDTEKAVELNAAVFFGNFPALDQVINEFNAYYPNVTISYNAVSDTSEADFLKNNAYLDIFMTSTERGYLTDSCVDLTAAGVDFSAVADGMLQSNTVDGKVLALPMGLTAKGVVVNKTLLEKEGLTMPQTWAEFLSVLDSLKQKGYTPIQGPESAMGDLCYSMAMAMISQDQSLSKAAMSGDTQGAAGLKVAYDRLQELYDKGYISAEVNATYPDDNYDGAILKFLEGDVPFWVCDTEKVSGMKKRETKSEAFTANPFTYEFTIAPMGDKGVYEYIEPWYGFAVNKDSERKDYAVEFLRFMAREDELNTLASVKGIPSIAKNAPDGLYTSLSDIQKVQISAVCDGSIVGAAGAFFKDSVADLRSGELANADEALAKFVSRCAKVAQES